MALTDSLAAYYKLDETSGNASDSVGSITLTNYGSTPYTTGLINNGADGETGTVDNQLLNTTQCPVTYAQTTSGFTISLWLKPNQTLDGTDRGFGGLNPSNGTLARYIQMRYFASSNTLQVRIGTSAGNTLFNTGINPTNGVWYHYVCTYDGSTLKTYVNDSNTSTDSFSIATGYGSSANLVSCMGGTGGLGSDNVGAVIDEYGFWSRALTSTEISELYNGGAGLAYPFAGAAVFRRKALLGVGQ